MPNVWAEKLRRFAPLSERDERLLDELVARPRAYGADEDIIAEGETPRALNLVLSGWVCRYKDLPGGGRQITAFLLPGDLCDLHVFLLRKMDHSLGTLTPATVASIPRQVILDITETRPQLTRALWWSTLLDEAILREWIVGIGRRDAMQHTAHLLVELFLRLRIVGETVDDSYELPLTQAELADALGLTNVHVNRVLMELRRQELITLADRTLTILDPEGLRKLAEFDPGYLHLAGGASRNGNGHAHGPDWPDATTPEPAPR